MVKKKVYCSHGYGKPKVKEHQVHFHFCLKKCLLDYLHKAKFAKVHEL